MAFFDATRDHESPICPACGLGFVAGDAVTSCDRCGEVYHASCWDAAGGCYACGSAVAGDRILATDDPEITVYADEARAVTPPPPREPVRPPEEVAAEYAPKGTAGGTWVALTAAALAMLGLVAVAGAVMEQRGLVALGYLFAFLSVIMAIVAAMLNWSRRRVCLTSIGVLAISCVVIVSVALTGHPPLDRVVPAGVGVIDENTPRPSDEQLAKLSRPIADALRANVIIVSKAPGGQPTHGSGVITRAADGKVYVLTNKHVLGEADVVVHFQNGHSAKGDTAWLAPEGVDLAYLACEAQPGAKYQPVPVRGDLANPGDPSFAVGNPMDLPWSYTAGVLSSVRTRQLGGHALHVYQTQTPINRGNSGGGLYTKDGELIGVNTWTQDKAVSEGISFSISTQSLLGLLSPALVREFIEQLAPNRASEGQAGEPVVERIPTV